MKITEIFGCKVFDDRMMKAKLPKDVYKKYRKTITENAPLEPELAGIIASVMKEWALENNATHYTHWFQPLSDVTAEKHDSFIQPSDDGSVILEFSGKELIKGEPDASSFPNGGLRDTYEARGYTAWDPTSPVFIKEGVLCIPSIFMSYTGESLDKKTPLLKSQDALNKQALRIVKLFGHNDVKSVKSTVGAEQEYFLIDKDLYDKRKDLIYTGRTLFGAKPPKTQEMNDHYFGVLKTRVKEYMEDLNQELWKLGITAKTQHNEVAPAQHELAPIFSVTNVATDHNQLTMELMKKVALRHGLVCLLHEKPFAGINGSGKHNNYSICTDTGINLFDPGKTPKENAQFLLSLVAFISATDEYQDLLRCSVASAGNDHRLGGHEAPPAIISIFIGEELEAILDSIVNDKEYTENGNQEMIIGIDALPNIPKDNTDRNRTSPMAFTGNKFEFRMLGSQLSISDCNIVLNTMMAKKFDEYATILENATDFKTALNQLIKDEVKKHNKIVFNGNGYGQEWIDEAKNRGLLNLKNTPEAMHEYLNDKNIKLFNDYHVFTSNELLSRYQIILNEYSKAINIEAETMINMVKKSLLPSSLEYINTLIVNIKNKKETKLNISSIVEENLANHINNLINDMYSYTEKLSESLIVAKNINDLEEKAFYYAENILPIMNSLRASVDELEQNTAKKYWPLPSYGDLLYSVK